MFFLMNCISNNDGKNYVKNFGYLKDGTASTVITLKNDQGTEISVSNFGATITSIKTADRNGIFKNIVIGYPNVTPYEKGTPYFGSTIGRFANRIAKGKFTIDNNLYYLPPESDYKPGEKKGTLVPEDADRLRVNNLYYNYNDKTWYLYDGVTLTPKFKTKR